MIKEIVKKRRKIKSNILLENKEHKKLSIQFNLDGFSFCISDLNSGEDVYFSEYTFSENQDTPENLLLRIQEIFNEDSYLQIDFKEIFVIHQNSLSTLVPNTFFNKDHLASYLKHSIQTLATDFITFDSIDALEIKNVYIPYININNYIFQNFGAFNYKHHSSILLEKLLKQSTNTAQTMYINVSRTSLDIVVLEKKKLLFYNSFAYNTPEDFIYYILFTAEQLKLDTNTFKLYFIGDIITDSDIYRVTYIYIRNVYFLESTNTIFNHLDAFKHTNYILLGL